MTPAQHRTGLIRDFGLASIEIPVRPKRPDHVRIPELDGFRAIAIWAVFLMHSLWGSLLGERFAQKLPHWLQFTLGHGWLGVDLFFVLSGFLITGILLDTRDEPGYFKNFYARRVLRIFPLYFACILAMSLGYPGYGKYFLLSAIFCANLARIGGVAEPHGPGVFWSLSVEEHFYMLWPVLNKLLSRRGFAILAASIVGLTPVARALFAAQGWNTHEQVYLYSWFRFDGLALGALLAMWVRSRYCSRRRSLALAAGLVAASLLITVAGLRFGIMAANTPASSGFRFTQAQLVFAAGMAAALALRGHWSTGFLRAPFMRVSAELSYCVYLVHLALGDAYDSVLPRLHLNPEAALGLDAAYFLRLIALIVLSFGIAALSRRWFEDRFLRLKRYF